MCGIAGIINSNREKRQAIDQMVEVITHRGPDEDGFYKDEQVALGMRRLSIIDLAHGEQPICSRDGNLLIIFNGEIYNYLELKEELERRGHQFETSSDTEVVLRMYEVFGSDSIMRLRGMFALAIYNKVTGEIFLARDFFGIKPLYYLAPGTGDRVQAFSSEMKSFLKLPGFNPEVNDRAVFNYLSYQYNPLSESFLKGVYKLSPGHYMRVQADGTYEINRYWSFEFDQDENLDEEETRQKILETMRDSVEHHMIADVPVGSFLSGGIDSSIIATLMSRSDSSDRGSRQGSGQEEKNASSAFAPEIPRTPPSESVARISSAKADSASTKIKTFTVGFAHVSEQKEARETADPLGTEHHEISVGSEEYFKVLPKAVWHFDEPVADPSAIGIYFLAREARKHVKVVLSGEGADELFGGYNIYLEPFARQKIAWIPKFVLRILTKIPLRGRNYARRALETLEERYIGNANIFSDKEVGELWRGASQEKLSLGNLYEQVRGQSDSTKMQYIDINTWLIGDILAKADKMTMAHSLELRVPFLDKQVADLARTLPDRFKFAGGRETKYLLREAFRKVLPESTRRRPKLGFPTAIRDWLRESEREEIFDLVRENKYIKEHFNMSEIEKLIKNHVTRGRDNSRKLYLLIMLALWYNVFIANEQV